MRNRNLSECQAVTVRLSANNTAGHSGQAAPLSFEAVNSPFPCPAEPNNESNNKSPLPNLANEGLVSKPKPAKLSLPSPPRPCRFLEHTPVHIDSNAEARHDTLLRSLNLSCTVTLIRNKKLPLPCGLLSPALFRCSLPVRSTRPLVALSAHDLQ